MKKVLILTNLFWVFLVGVFCLNSCKETTSSSSKVVLDYSGKEFKSLPLASAQLLANNYKKNYLSLINKTYNISDARTIWFSLDDLKNFIWQIEYHSVNAGAKINPSDLGIRMYYGQYPSETEIKGNASLKIIPEYGGKHTLFMVPTILQDTINMEFDPRALFKKHVPGTNNTIQPLFNRGDKKSNFFNFIQDDEATIMNHGGLCPPCKPPKEY
jgi:hypothetical protein